MGAPLSVELDTKRRDQTKLIIRGVEKTASWQKLKDHFALAGKVAFVQVAEPKNGRTAPTPPATRPTSRGPITPVENRRVMAAPASSRPTMPADRGIAGLPPGFRAPPRDASAEYRRGWEDAYQQAHYDIMAGYGSMVGAISGQAAMFPMQAAPAELMWPAPRARSPVSSGRARPSQATPSAASTARPRGLDLVGEVRYSRREDTNYALRHEHMLGGQLCRVTRDLSFKEGTKLLVMGIPQTVSTREMRLHFARFGEIMSSELRQPPPEVVQQANAGRLPTSTVTSRRVHGVAARPPSPVSTRRPRSPEPVRSASSSAGRTAEVRFEGVGDTPQRAVRMAVQDFDRKQWGDKLIRVERDEASHDGSKIRIFNLPEGISWQHIKDEFRKCGDIAFVRLPK